MQWRAAIWITGAFRTSPTEGVEAIVGLVPITSHLRKLNGRHHLQYASIPLSHAINSLLDVQHAKNFTPHRFAMSKLIAKQQINLKSLIKDINECLNGIVEYFNPLHPIFSSGSRVVGHFSSRVKFHSPLSSSEDDLYLHLQKLNYVFNMLQVSLHSSAVIANSGVKKSHATSVVAYIWVDNSNIKQLQMHSTHITPNKAELIAIWIGLIHVMEINDMHDIIVITDFISVAQKILESKVNPFQNIVIPLVTKIKSYLSKDARNNIYFWYCSSKANWP